MPRHARRLSDNAPPLEELAATIIPRGIQAGKLTEDGNGGYRIDQELLQLVAPYLTSWGIRGLHKKRRHWYQRNGHTRYIEEVLKAVEKNGENGSVRSLSRRISLWEEKYHLTPALGLGLVAIHLYYQGKAQGL